jgi:Methylase involved in ubiquinone/menaquinone biosynthesis
MMRSRLANALRMLDIRALRLGHWICALCGNRIHIRLKDSDVGVRCLRCGASAITQSIIGVIRAEVPDLSERKAYELSSRGAMVEWLRKQVRSLTTSEYMTGVSNGEIHLGVRCEDVQHLTFPDASFDLCTSTEVFEHVEDDMAGFREIWRILRPGGILIFTVPMTDSPATVERAHREGGEWVHLLEPEYHSDPYTGYQPSLCVRNYGLDIQDRLRQSGFSRVSLVRPANDLMGYARKVLVARR